MWLTNLTHDRNVVGSNIISSNILDGNGVKAISGLISSPNTGW